MIVKSIDRIFDPITQTPYKNLLVSGCSFTYNNSNKHIVTWPYYLRDLANFEQVIDCSQSGAGNGHIFNSIINEIETNKNINPTNTLIIIMLSGFSRTDVIASVDFSNQWHGPDSFKFNDKFATLSIMADPADPNEPNIVELCKKYKRVVDIDAQVLESCFRVLALDGYLKSKGFNYILTPWKDIRNECIDSNLIDSIGKILHPIKCLGEYATRSNQLEPDGHPSPDAHLHWTKDYLIPYLTTNFNSI